MTFQGLSGTFEGCGIFFPTAPGLITVFEIALGDGGLEDMVMIATTAITPPASQETGTIYALEDD